LNTGNIYRFAEEKFVAFILEKRDRRSGHYPCLETRWNHVQKEPLVIYGLQGRNFKIRREGEDLEEHGGESMWEIPYVTLTLQ